MTSRLMEMTVKVYKEQTAAINNLDFDMAAEITRRAREELELETDAEQSYYVQQADNLMQSTYNAYIRDINLITENGRQTIVSLQALWKEMCIKLANMQEMEARELEEKWYQEHYAAESNLSTRYDTSMQTAKILARYEHYDKAEDVVDMANSELRNMDRTPVAQVDRIFQQRYQAMIEAHEEQYVTLHRKLKNIVDLIYQIMDFERAKVEGTRKINDARTPSNVMKAVSIQSKNETAKNALLKTFSPRSSQKSARSNKSQSFRSGVPTPLRS